MHVRRMQILFILTPYLSYPMWRKDWKGDKEEKGMFSCPYLFCLCWNNCACAKNADSLYPHTISIYPIPMWRKDWKEREQKEEKEEKGMFSCLISFAYILDVPCCLPNWVSCTHWIASIICWSFLQMHAFVYGHITPQRLRHPPRRTMAVLVW